VIAGNVFNFAQFEILKNRRGQFSLQYFRTARKGTAFTQQIFSSSFQFRLGFGFRSATALWQKAVA